MNRPPAPAAVRGRPAQRPPAMPRPLRTQVADAPPSAAGERPPLAPSSSPRDDRRAVRSAARQRRRALGAELRRPRVRRRRAVLAVAALVVSAVAMPAVLAFAPVFTLSSVAVQGADAGTAAAVRRVLAGQQGRPLALVSDDDVAAALARVPAVASFQAVRRPPSTLELRVVERTPIAVVRTAGGWQRVDADGVRLGAGAPGALPRLTVTGARAAAMRAAAAAITATAAAGVAVSSVDATGADDVALTLPGGAVVQWGGAEGSAAKARALKAALRHAAKGARTIDVSAPGVVLVH